ncbi:MAG: methyltransferase dimerization domain-containing protein [Methylocella sp.]
MSNTAPSVTPERILQFVWAFAPPLAIEAAIHHRVFDVLEKQPLALAELAQATGASARGLSAIADLLVAFALLTRDLLKAMRFLSATSRASWAGSSVI